MTQIPFPVTPRESIAHYTSYVDAQRAVDYLSDEGFPVKKVQIVGTDLRMVEQVYGRLDWNRAALTGIAQGAWLGLLIGLFLSLFADGDGDTGTAGLILFGLGYGAVFGLIFGLIRYGMSGGKRDFVSRSQIIPSQYDILVETDASGRARQVLAGLPTA